MLPEPVLLPGELHSFLLAALLLILALSSDLAILVSSFTGVPAEVVLVRMCSDLNRPREQRYNYRNAVQALFKITADEGFTTLFRGMVPNVTRSVFLNVA